MDRYINANDLYDEVYKSRQNNPHLSAVLKRAHNDEHSHFLHMITETPTADVKPIVYGTWTACSCGVLPEGVLGVKCSVCGRCIAKPLDTGYGYCPCCGAKMELGDQVWQM